MIFSFPKKKRKVPRTFRSECCSIKVFREIREMANAWADHIGQRRKQWFVIDPENPKCWPCCYAIYFDGSLIYVGQTENLKGRLSAHRTKGALRGRDLDKITIKAKLGRRYGDWAMTEARLIKRLKPLLNVARIGEYRSPA